MPQRTFARPVEVQITGSILIYDVDDPVGGKGEPVKALAAQFPDLRRFIREGYVRYAFTRFGVPYVVSIQCLDSAPRARRLACREAYPVAERFLKALHVAGGLPSRPRMDIASEIAERPAERSPDFTYRPSGDIIANSASASRAATSTSPPIRKSAFRWKRPLAFVHSQEFRNRRSSDKPIDELAGSNTSYPWRDNFCEARSFNVGQCPSGFGHQGEDIRPAPCPPHSRRRRALRPQAAGGRRRPRRRRDPRAEAAGGDAAGQHPQRTHSLPLHAHESGRAGRRRRAERAQRRRRREDRRGFELSRPPQRHQPHLHFDVQVFTRDGWIWVNPYVTLISAYERLIRGRGREIGPEVAASPAVAHALPEDVSPSRRAGRQRELDLEHDP